MKTSKTFKEGELTETFVLPVFPLPGCVLFENSLLPLHIFEERYREMVRDADRDPSRKIGMIQPCAVLEASEPELYRIGGVGKITESKELPDGRFVVVLEGLGRFEIVKELPKEGKAYRRVEARMVEKTDALPMTTEEERGVREEIVRSLQNRVENLSELEKIPFQTVIHELSRSLPWETGEKQLLLEANGLRDRAKLLVELLKMDTLGQAVSREKETIH